MSLQDFDFGAVLKDSVCQVELDSSALARLKQLDQAVMDGDIAAVSSICAALRADSTNPEHLGPALTAAITSNRLEMVSTLLAAGSPTKAIDVEVAATLHLLEILQLLIKHGWPINEPLGADKPPVLAYAIKDLKISLWLLQHGADPNASCVFDETPLSVAVQNGSLEAIRLLFDHGGDVKKGELLHYAIWRQRSDKLEVIKLLLDKGASLNKVMYRGRPYAYDLRAAFGLGTPLHAAAASGDVEVVMLLLSHGADVTVQDSCGHLPYQTAQFNGHAAVVQLLIRHAFQT